MLHTCFQIVILKEGQTAAHLSLNPCIFMWREGYSSSPSSSSGLPSPPPPLTSSSASSIELVMFDMCPGLDTQVSPYCAHTSSSSASSHMHPPLPQLIFPAVAPRRRVSSARGAVGRHNAILPHVPPISRLHVDHRRALQPRVQASSRPPPFRAPASHPTNHLDSNHCASNHRLATRDSPLEPCSSYTPRWQPSSPSNACPPETLSCCSACRQAVPAQRIATSISFGRVLVDG